MLPRQEDPAIPASSDEHQDMQVSTYAPGRPDAEGAAGRSPGHGCQPVIVLPEALAPAQVIQISRFCVPSRSRAGSRRAVHIGGSVRVLPRLSLIAQRDAGIGRQVLRAAVFSRALATRTVPAGFTAAFPDMAVCWGCCPLMVRYRCPPRAREIRGTRQAPRSPVSPGPTGLTGFRPVPLRCPPGRPHRLACSWRVRRTRAEHGQSR